jgi:Dolichyl-phosphate-mannose-protein mannosyltransferase
VKYFKSDFFLENKFLFIIAFANFLLVYLSSFTKGYGYFIDEFYYIACAVRPAMGYVDHPPLAPLILTVFQSIFGTSLLAIRLLPALAESASVFFMGILTKEIGGGRFAQCLAAIALATSPLIVTMAGFYSMNAYEPLIAIALLIFIVKMIKENNAQQEADEHQAHRRWIILGIIMGLGLMNKHTFAIFIVVLVFSLLVSGKWRLVFNKWFAVGSLITLVIFLPNIIWQIMNHWPSVEFYRNVTLHKNVYTPPFAFFLTQVIDMSAATFPIWLAGIIFLLFSKRVKEFKFLPVLFLSLFLIMMLSGSSRPDRLAFAYPAVFAGGAIFFESFILKHNLKWLKGALIIFLYAGLALALPISLPYFNYEYVSGYAKAIGFNTELEAGNKPSLPQLLADKIGWKEKFNLVLNAYDSLSDKEKKETIIAAGNYGQAGAIELFGKKYNFPAVVCGHNNYYLWSRDKLHGNILLQLSKPKDINRLKKLFNDVAQFPGEFTNPYVTSHENNLVVFICRGPKIPYSKMLEKAKFYY